VQRKIASLSLIVYLLGGWLLPALHRHGHGDCGGNHAGSGYCEGFHTQTTPASHARHSHYSCKCKPTADRLTESDETRPQDLSSCQVSGDGASASRSHGVCSICIAKNSPSVITLNRRLDFQREIIESQPIAIDLAIPKRRYDLPFSRGPPVFA
jgi:hypothetical protein